MIQSRHWKFSTMKSKSASTPNCLTCTFFTNELIVKKNPKDAYMIMKCDRIFLNNADVNILWYVAQEKRVKETFKKMFVVNMNRFYLF